MTQPALIPDAVLPLLLAAADAGFVPVQLWPLDTAMIVLDRETSEESEIGRALDRMPQARITTGQRFTGLGSMIDRLVASGALVPNGEGWEAGYTVAPGLLDRGRRTFETLPLPDQAALHRAAQTFSDALRMLSKKSPASLPIGSATI